MKRFFAILLAASCILASGCSKDNQGESTAQVSSESSSESTSSSSSSANNGSLEAIRTTLPHNMSIKFNDTQENVISLDGLIVDDDLTSNSADGTEWYTTEESVTVNGFAFSPAKYTFADNKINSLTYYSEDDSTEFTTYIPQYIYQSLISYFESVYGDYKERKDEDGNNMYLYWEISLDDSEIYTLELFYINPTDDGNESSNESSSEGSNEYVVIVIYSGSYS